MSDTKLAVASGVCFTLAGALIVSWIVHVQTDTSWRKQINEHGCGHYYLDGENARQWNWKPCDTHEKP